MDDKTKPLYANGSSAQFQTKNLMDKFTFSFYSEKEGKVFASTPLATKTFFLCEFEWTEDKSGKFMAYEQFALKGKKDVYPCIFRIFFVPKERESLLKELKKIEEEEILKLKTLPNKEEETEEQEEKDLKGQTITDFKLRYTVSPRVILTPN